MPSTSRRFALVILLLVVLLPLAVAIAGTGACTDECGVACGDCLVCGIAGCLTAPAALRSETSGLAVVVARSTPPNLIAVRAIEHVPLRFA